MTILLIQEINCTLCSNDEGVCSCIWSNVCVMFVRVLLVYLSLFIPYHNVHKQEEQLRGNWILKLAFQNVFVYVNNTLCLLRSTVFVSHLQTYNSWTLVVSILFTIYRHFCVPQTDSSSILLCVVCCCFLLHQKDWF